MSKSLGNAIDPLEIIEEYGADALRFSLIINSGQDIFISKEKFEIGRNFANKVWNAARLVFMNSEKVLAAGDYEYLDIKKLDLPSRWIVARFYETLDKVSKTIETFRYSEAEILVQDFFWGNYCDWYLELIKAKFSDTNVQKTALFVLKNSLKLMHPFIPFVTEEIYSKMHPKESCLSVASWPKKDKALIDDSSAGHMQLVIDVIGAIRNIRSEWKIKPQEPLNCLIIPYTAGQKEQLTLSSPDIRNLAKLEKLEINLSKPALKNSAVALAQSAKIFIPLEGLVDIEAEKKKKSAEIAQKQKAIEGLEGRLNNQAFVSKAPEDVITKEKERLAELKRDVQGLNQVLTNLN